MLARLGRIVAATALAGILLAACSPANEKTQIAGASPTTPGVVFQGVSHMENTKEGDPREGYTFDIHWTTVSPKTQSVTPTKSTMLGMNDLELAFETTFILKNTTPGNRTLSFTPTYGPTILAFYPGDSAVCKYGSWEATDERCMLAAGPSFASDFYFHDIGDSESIVEGQSTDPKNRSFAFMLTDVPDDEVEKVSGELRSYTDLQVATPASAYESQCSAHLDGGNGYTVIGVPGTKQCEP